MKFFDRFKKQEQKKADQKRSAAQAAPVALEKRPKTIREEVQQARGAKEHRKGKTTGVYAHRILLKPIVSEKSARLHSLNQYVFKVATDANKISIKKAIFEAYHSEPVDVNIIRVQGKTIVRGRTKGFRSSYKKAVVTMAKGVTLPVYEGV